MRNHKSQTSKYSFFSLLAAGSWLLIAAPPARAQSTEEVDIGSGVEGFFGFKCITEFVFNMVDVAIIISGVALLVYLVWGGVEWLISGGDKTKVQSAQSRLTNALIGVTIVAASYATWKLALAFFGINAPNICSLNPLSQ